MIETYKTYEQISNERDLFKAELERLRTSSYGTETRREWNDDGYGNLKEKIILNPDGSHTNQLAIEKYNRVVNFMTTSYWVVPNFDILRVVTPILEKSGIGAKPFTPSNEDSSFRWMNSNRNTGYDPNGTEMVSSYVFGEKFDITGNKDFVQCGFTIRNSESGKGAFSISPFTHRNSCDNRMYHLASERVLGAGVLVQLAPDEAMCIQKDRIMAEKERFGEIIRGFKKSHTKTINLKLIERAILTVKLGGEQVINRYKEMYQMKILKAQAEAIAKKMPQFITKNLDWLTIKEKTGEVSYKSDTSQWDAFNDLTRLLTHEGKNFIPTLNQFKKVDEILVHQRVRGHRSD
jgi:hypothetical protein